MPITPIPNQPINLVPYEGDECLIGDDKAYTPLYNTGDALYVQMINAPCPDEPQLFCNPLFQAGLYTFLLYGPENFTVDLAGWVAGAAWSWNTGGGIKTVYSSGTTLSKTAYYDFTPGTFITGMGYLVVFTIVSNTTTTGMGVSPILQGDIGPVCSTPGTYTINLTAQVGVVGERLSFIQSGGSDGTLVISNVTIYATLNCITSIGTGWAVEQGGATHSVGTASGLVAGSLFVTTESPYGYFYIEISVENMTAGSVTIAFGGSNVGVISANGSYTFYDLAANGDNLSFNATSDFDGRITRIWVQELRRDYSFLIKDEAGSTVQDLVADGKVIYVKDRIVIAVLLDSIDTSVGCFQIEAGDPCTSTTYLSNIFEVNTEHPCAKLMIGYGSGLSLGFLWGGFYLSHRVRFLSFNPDYPIDGDDYQPSDGTRVNTYSKREKYYVGKIDYVDETTHDTISTQIICPTYTIDGVAYFVKQQGYKPEWDKNGQQKLAQANIELRKVGGTIYSK